MTVSIKPNSGGTCSIQVDGLDRLIIANDGLLSSSTNPPTGLRSEALATMKKFSDEFPIGLVPGSSGYQRLPSGLLIQWGFISIVNGGPSVGSFCTSFPSSCYAITCSDGGSGVHNTSISALNLSQWQAWSRLPNGASPSGITGASYVAIGI